MNAYWSKRGLDLPTYFSEGKGRATLPNQLAAYLECSSKGMLHLAEYTSIFHPFWRETEEEDWRA